MINQDKEFQADNLLVFIDIETTGLNRLKDKILEVGISVTDLQMNVLGTWSSLVISDEWRERLSGNQLVWDMHTKSGLIKEIDAIQDEAYQPDDLSPAVVAWKAYRWLKEEMGLIAGIQPSCGNSVHFDRDMLKEIMPVLDSFFTYRNIDISTVKELCRRYNRELFNGIKVQFKKEDVAHRVKEDIESSIRELRCYIENFLFAPGNKLEGLLESGDNQPVLPGMESLK